MIAHFIRIFVRSMSKHAGHSLVNIFGLVLGMTASLLISLYVAYEKSYDEFHPNKENIYRVRHDRYTNHELTRQFSAGPMGIGDDLKRAFPEVVRFTRLNAGDQRNMTVSNGDVRFKERRIFFASEDFFKVFHYDLISGVDSTVLKDLFTMVVSESFAKKYFGDADPLGRSLKTNNKEEYTITGVFKDLPDNTHLKVDALLSFPSLHKIIGKEWTDEAMNSWGWEGNWTYIELTPDSDIQAFSEKVKPYVERETAEFSKLYNEQMSFFFQPLTSIHLESNTKDELEAGGSAVLVDFLSWIAAFILLISWINYINLATAKAVERAREVGIRKILGTQRRDLIAQFILESTVTMLFAFLITLSAVAIILPSFASFVERQLTLNVFMDLNTWLMIATVFIVGIFFAGLYPALVMSGFKPALVLKGNFKTSHKGTNLRRSLVTFQFVASIVLITGTVAMYSQVQFMQEQPLGMNDDNVLVINGPSARPDDQQKANKIIHETLASWPFIESSTSSLEIPGQPVITGTVVRLEGKTKRESSPVRVIQCDHNFIKTYGISLIAGRDFTADKNEQWKSAIVNESAMTIFGFSDPNEIIGEKLLMWDDTVRVVGVVKNYHHESLKRKVDELVFVCDLWAADYISIKFDAGTDLAQLLSTAGSAFDTAFPENTFHYFFMNDYFERQYRSEVAFNNLTAMFAILATLISCLGLFGLSSYMIVQRAKEIGIRKVLGATARQIVLLMSKEYVIIILIANMIASPLAYLLMSEWLNGFAYRIDLNVFMYIVPGICALLIAVATIAGQSIKASAEDPVKSLRSE